MPSKPKNTREEIITAALSIMREKGPSGLTARELGRRLGASPSTLFTHFDSMVQIDLAAREAGWALYNRYVERGLAAPSPLRGFAVEALRFAADEPYLYATLFLSPGTGAGPADLMISSGHWEDQVQRLARLFSVPVSVARHVYEGLTVCFTGIAVMVARGIWEYDEEEICAYLIEVCRGLLLVNQEKEDKSQAT